MSDQRIAEAAVRTFVTHLPDRIAAIRVVTPETTVAVVSDELDEQEQTAARTIAAYVAREHGDETVVRPFVLIRTRDVFPVVIEAYDDPPEPFTAPEKESPSA